MNKQVTINWSQYVLKKEEQFSFSEKIRILIKNKNKLVKVQADTILNISLKNDRSPSAYAYVEQLFKHYIVENLPKTYLCN